MSAAELLDSERDAIFDSVGCMIYVARLKGMEPETRWRLERSVMVLLQLAGLDEIAAEAALRVLNKGYRGLFGGAL